ncbi:MAG TPA: DUF3368 domain-containing protein [Tenuifilaceae bacterium]|nr:DUF3368 domain-containing protein [Tenuifilaceae bacterium]
MPKITVIADTSCLIAFSKIEAIELLKKLYGEVYVTEEIALEFGESLPEWIRIESVKNKKYQQLLDLYLDLGEASAIALALEKVDVLLVLDDLKGRKEAEKLGFRITGTLGILFKAKKNGLISELKCYIEKLKAVGFRLSSKIEEEILRKSNEN